MLSLRFSLLPISCLLPDPVIQRPPAIAGDLQQHPAVDCHLLPVRLVEGSIGRLAHISGHASVSLPRLPLRIPEVALAIDRWSPAQSCEADASWSLPVLLLRRSTCGSTCPGSGRPTDPHGVEPASLAPLIGPRFTAALLLSGWEPRAVRRAKAWNGPVRIARHCVGCIWAPHDRGPPRHRGPLPRHEDRPPRHGSGAARQRLQTVIQTGFSKNPCREARWTTKSDSGSDQTVVP